MKRRNFPFYIPKAVRVYVCWWWWRVREKDHKTFQPSSETKMSAKKESERKEKKIENSEL